MRGLLAGLALGWALLSANPVLAWGWQGHQYVANIAYDLLNPAARKQVNALLGANGAGKPVSLADAAVWPDCARDITGPDNGPKRFKKTKYTSNVCVPIAADTALRAWMEDYADRNWTNCVYAGQPRGCHKAFHFDDVNVHEHGDYKPDYFGAEKSDVVRAIKAAITVLQCPVGQVCPFEGPFNIKDKREALFLLTHFVGDVHQPLHVGAVYLQAGGASGDDGAQTAGGNLLLLSPGDTADNLHHDWDTIPKGLGVHAPASVVSAACKVPTVNADLIDRPAAWASESVVAAKAAYGGLTYAKDAAEPKYWDITFTDKAAYANDLRTAQRRQMQLAGARLAETLNTIWPSATRATVCSAAP